MKVIKRIAFLVCLVGLFNTGCATEKLHVTVIDSEGRAVSNATVTVGVSPTSAFWGNCNGEGKEYKAKTDTNGLAVVRFNCTRARFGWSVETDGYYRSGPFDAFFTKFDEIIVAPGVAKVILHEHEKHDKVTLWKKRNPQPMMAHGVGYEADEHPVPSENGRYGFDMMKFDWLPPLGKGEVADFHFVRRIGEEVPDGVVGYLEFPDNCGMYAAKQTGCESFPSTYEADTNASFRSHIPFIFDHSDAGGKAITYKDIVGKDDYGVMRTRVECDERGRIVKANYSKVLGPFRFGDANGKWVIYTRCAVFNPRVNDSNLESDPGRSYDPKLKRPMLAP